MADEDDVRTVAHFVRRLRRVAQHPLARNHGELLDQLAKVPVTVTKTTGGKALMRSPLPDEVAFESLATRLRPFLEPRDDLHFEKAFNALGRLLTPDYERFRWIVQEVHEEWRASTERSDRTRAYFISTEAQKYSDVVLAFSWLYGDSVHGDHEKVETLNILERFRAAVGFFSGVAVVALATSNMLRQLVELGAIELPEEAFTDHVVVTEREIIREVEAYETDVGIDVSDDLAAFMESGQPLPAHIRPLHELMAELRAQRPPDHE
jgi:hypothetical protein